MFGKPDKEPDLELFTVFDQKSRTYREPFPAKNKDVCLRDFSNAFADPEAPQKNAYYQNAEDYSLYRIGSFDKRTGEIKVDREHILNLIDLRAMSLAQRSTKNVEGALSPT